MALDKELVRKFLPLFVSEYGSYADLNLIYRNCRLGKISSGEPPAVDSKLRTELADWCVELMVTAVMDGDGLSGKWGPREGNGPVKHMTTPEAQEKARFARACARLYLACSLGSDEKISRQTTNGLPDGKLKPKAKNYASPKGRDRQECARKLEAAQTNAIKTGVGIKGAVSEAHSLAKHYVNGGPYDKMIEAQWSNLIKELKDDITAGGGLDSCIALCDVSGSMYGIPMEVCVALGLIVSEIAPDPWKGRVLTFQENPTWHKIKGSDLSEKVRNLISAPWGGNTDFGKTLNLILKTAVDNSLTQDQMPKVMFVFSDMQFDQADRSCSGYGGSHYYREGAVVQFYAIAEDPTLALKGWITLD